MPKRTSVLSPILVLLLAFASAPAFAGGNKVDVCHLPPGNPENWHTISVSSNAAPAHLAHGDLEGSCAENCESLCGDGDACTQDIESNFDQCLCNAVPRPSVNCDDSNPCTLDACNSEFGCVYDTTALNGTACDDGDPDSTGDVCTDGVCAGVTVIACDGGNETSPGAWPWQLSLERFDGSDWQHVCGATLLSGTRAVTAASCVFGEPDTDFRVVAGLHTRSDLAGTQTSAVFSYSVHPMYTGADPGLTFDAAILLLSTSIATGGNVAFATLPPNDNDDFSGDTGVITGWGETALAAQIPNDVLQGQDSSVLSNSACETSFSDEGLSGAISSTHLCAFSGTLDPCTGDIGGPVQVPDSMGGHYLGGIQSWAVDYVVSYADASTVPRVATRTSDILDWFDVCGNNFCINDGTCVPNADGITYSCDCQPGFTGGFCEIDPCGFDHCQNGGVCIRGDSGTTYSCDCPPGYSGTNCETEDP